MTDHLTELEAAARAATPGPWKTYLGAHVTQADQAIDVTSDLTEFPFSADVFGDRWADDARYIALASPERVLALIAAARTAERLMRVLDLASSVHTPERRQARLALRAALAALKEQP